jgi:hypothetical protein
MRRVLLPAVVCALLAGGAWLGGAGPRFLPDDPLAVEPETQDAAKAKPRDIDLIWDLAENLVSRPGDPARDVRAGNVNTIDEVPDSSWFTNRIFARPLSIAEAVRGPLEGDGPAPGGWTITHPKTAGFAPGFRIRDSAGVVWFVSFDPAGFEESATGALAVANKLFWALGYFQVENYLTWLRPDQLTIAPTARIRAESGQLRPMRQDDLDAVLARAARAPDGRYRIIAARGLSGTILGGFEYHGTRADDPNDIVPHEHRRELRALKVFGAWLNLVDMKAGNTLDVLVPGEGGRQFVRHYLQDVGSTFGVGANGPRQFDEGWESLLDTPRVLARLFTLGLYMRPWQRVRYNELPAIGRFEGDAFDPRTWSPRVPPAAFRQSRADDEFWAARRVMAFSDEMIRAVVRTGGYSDSRAEQLLADVLIKRRDAIGRAYLPAITPLAGFTFDATSGLAFVNVAEQAKVAAAPSDGYRVQWLRMDNATGETAPIGGEVRLDAPSAPPPSVVPSGDDAVLTARVWAEDPDWPAWRPPIDVSFMRAGNGWRLVGIERVLPAAVE